MEKLVIKPSGEFLTAKNIEFLLAQISGISQEYATIDLSAIKFFDPYALIMLLLIQKNGGTARGIQLLYPADAAALNYMRAIGFFSPSPVPDKKDESTVLLRISRIDSGKNVTGIIKNTIDKIDAALDLHLHYRGGDKTNLLTALSELCQNIVDHSESSGFAAMQIYKTKTGAKYAVIGVGDIGIGIRTSLSSRHEVSRWTDSMAIRNALKPNFSRFIGRGLGLTRVKEIAEKYNGSLLLRSNKGIVTFNRKISSKTAVSFPGTQAAIYLRENRRLL